MPSAFEIASGLVGTREGQAALADFLHTGGQNLDPVTTAWCAAFVNASLAQAGLPGSGSMMARSFLNYGTPVDEPQIGDIAVFARGRAPEGHVGFYQGIGPDGRIRVLGGNQGDAVSVASMAPGALLGYRRPGAGDGSAIAGQGAPASQSPMMELLSLTLANRYGLKQQMAADWQPSSLGEALITGSSPLAYMMGVNPNKPQNFGQALLFGGNPLRQAIYGGLNNMLG